jgi:hypothetical protein
MKRFTMALLLACALSSTALAGDVPSTGAPSPGEIPIGGSATPADIPCSGSTAPGDIPSVGLSVVLAILDLAF